MICRRLAYEGLAGCPSRLGRPCRGTRSYHHPPSFHHHHPQSMLHQIPSISFTIHFVTRRVYAGQSIFGFFNFSIQRVGEMNFLKGITSCTDGRTSSGHGRFEETLRVSLSLKRIRSFLFCFILRIRLCHLASYLDLYSAVSAVAFRVSGSFAALFPLLATSPHKRTKSVIKEKRKQT